jgi:hypothetical protein
MESTDTQILPYPEQDDPADDALDLQVLAEAIDAKLVASFADFRAILNNEVFIATLTANQTGFGATPTEIVFDSTLYDSTVDGVDFPESPFFSTTGYYRIGTYVISVPAGAVNVNTERLTYLEFRQQLALPPGSVVIEQWVTTNWESNTSGEHQVAEGLIRVDSVENPGSFLHVLFLSGNTSSTTTVFAGSMLWFYKVSELESF